MSKKAKGYPPGYFLDPVYAWFGKGWKSSMRTSPYDKKFTGEMNSRERGLDDRKLWASGFLGNLSNKEPKVDLEHWNNPRFNPRARTESERDR